MLNVRMSIRRIGMTLVAAIFLTAPWAAQADRQPLEDIRATAAEWAKQAYAEHGDTLEVEIGRLDSRLRLARCDGELEGFSPHGDRGVGNLTVGVRCTGTQPWTVYVTARVDTEVEVLVAAQPLRRGERIRPGSLTLETRSLSSLNRPYETEADRLMGMEVRRSLRRGDLISQTALAQPQLVHRGRTVTLRAGNGTVAVTGRGKALENGSMGDIVRVESGSSGRVIEGRVVGESLIAVGQ